MKLFFLQFSKPFEGYGPQATGEDGDEEIPYSIGKKMALEERVEGGFCKGFDQKKGHKTQSKLQYLNPPKGFGIKADETLLDFEAEPKTHGAAQHGIGIFDTTLQTGKVCIRGKGRQVYIGNVP